MPVHTDAELLAASDLLSAGFFRAASRFPWADIHDDGDVVHGTTGIPIEVFNGATCARFDEATADERIEQVLAPMRAERIDMSWMVGSTSARSSASRSTPCDSHIWPPNRSTVNVPLMRSNT